MSTEDDMQAAITQLQAQQALTVAGLAQLLQGRSIGENSLEAYLYAIDPALTGTLSLDPPVPESVFEAEDVEPPKG